MDYIHRAESPQGYRAELRRIEITPFSRDCRGIWGQMETDGGLIFFIMPFWLPQYQKEWAIGPEKLNSLNDPADHDAPPRTISSFL